ncbi:MAG: GNAT family N-acetyltransferase, partial [Chloroflexi bacterium]|nr:GNAT family N-acetyltransferase [Chloroflexota bacterium]
MPMNIRPATEPDQATIKRIVRAARINPFDLKWQKFLVAEDADAIIGVGQIKTHDDGSRELASIAVVPEKQKQGIGAAIVRALMQAQTPPLYLM